MSDARLTRILPWPALALIGAAVLLAIAHGFQTFGGYQPCLLCLQQRQVYWAAIAIALVLLVARRVGAPKAAAVLGWLLVLSFAAETAIAVRHAGAEWKWWPGPEGCSGVGHATAAGIARLLKASRANLPHCDVAPWRMLGLSMAGYNALAALGLTLFCLAGATRSPGR